MAASFVVVLPDMLKTAISPKDSFPKEVRPGTAKWKEPTEVLMMNITLILTSHSRI